MKRKMLRFDYGQNATSCLCDFISSAAASACSRILRSSDRSARFPDLGLAFALYSCAVNEVHWRSKRRAGDLYRGTKSSRAEK
jgi:hypothetical protein